MKLIFPLVLAFSFMSSYAENVSHPLKNNKQVKIAQHPSAKAEKSTVKKMVKPAKQNVKQNSVQHKMVQTPPKGNAKINKALWHCPKPYDPRLGNKNGIQPVQKYGDSSHSILINNNPPKSKIFREVTGETGEEFRSESGHLLVYSTGIFGKKSIDIEMKQNFTVMSLDLGFGYMHRVGENGLWEVQLGWTPFGIMHDARLNFKTRILSINLHAGFITDSKFHIDGVIGWFNTFNFFQNTTTSGDGGICLGFEPSVVVTKWLEIAFGYRYSMFLYDPKSNRDLIISSISKKYANLKDPDYSCHVFALTCKFTFGHC